ncbi:MAG: nucleotidyl transferase AbiEii/AbiGii toxin family protein [Candidatus Aenigmatarchaeota archaeon]
MIAKRVKENSICSRLVFNRTEISFEAAFRKVSYILREYETYEGLLINIYTLSAEDMIMEKINAYLKRREIRDLYDIFFLLRYVKDDTKVRLGLKKIIDNFAEPEDEHELKALILFGVVPKSYEMIDYIKRWLK